MDKLELSIANRFRRTLAHLVASNTKRLASKKTQNKVAKSRERGQVMKMKVRTVSRDVNQYVV